VFGSPNSYTEQMRLARLALFLLFIASVAVGQFTSKRLPKIVKVRPSEFPELPANLLQELNRRHCMIPQLPKRSNIKRQNVINGEFAKAGQVDWAVLCSSRGRTGRILVFWNGSELNPSTVDVGRLGLYTSIGPISEPFITKQHSTWGPFINELPTEIDHQGIVSGSDSQSTVMYYYEGKWLTLNRTITAIY